MKVIIAGSTGMIGGLVLEHYLNAEQINEVVSLVRKSTGAAHAKLKEVVIADFEDYSAHHRLFADAHAAFFCIGVYTGQVPDDQFKKITIDYAVQFAIALRKSSPKVKLCFLSGSGADRSEKSRAAFARYKGMAENQIAGLGLEFYSFRPGYIYPVTPRKEPNLMYRISRTLYPLIKLFGKGASIKSTELATAMFNVGLAGAEKNILENRDILECL